MTGSLLLTCNSRSASISIHHYDHALRRVIHLRDVTLPMPAGKTHASPMARNADGTLIYLAWRGAEKRLLTFALDRAKAELELVQNRAMEDDFCFLHATADRTQLLGAGGDSVRSLLLDDNGRPAEIMPALPVGPMAHCVVTDDRGRIYATSCRGDLLRSFAEDGAVEELAQPQGSGPRHLCLSADGNSLFLVTQESGEVVRFLTHGGLREMQRLTMVDEADAPMGGDIGITPDGHFVYATERSHNRVVGFAVEEGGLRRIGAAEVPDYPRALCIGGGGTFLAVLGFRDHRAAIFAIGSDGQLSPAAEFATGERPSWMLAVDAS